MSEDIKLEVKNLTMSYGSYVVMNDLSFSVKRSEIFLIVGGSGCGKSTLLKYLIGLKRCPRGTVFYDDTDICNSSNRESMYKKMGVLYQSGALWSSMTIAENIALILEEYSLLSKKDIERMVHLKLALVGLDGFEDFYPAQLSGGMKKRAGLARALALDPEILFLDEPSAGLDPVSAAKLDELILKIRTNFGTTIIAVTHDLDSIFKIGDRIAYLDAASKTLLAVGKPNTLKNAKHNLKVANFLSREYTA
ncbi:MAG: ATP-binding cassette domain-containing protein [Opitutales bacterium]|nr:ATP-binding cassette domain-containing protein [Opitutales bacterium]